jgi:hypothetical protein
LILPVRSPCTIMNVFRVCMSRSSTSRIYLMGLPPHICRLGTTRPGGTTEFGVIIHPFSKTAPSIITEFAPMNTSFPMRHEFSVQPGCTATLLSIVKLAGRPLGMLADVNNTQFSAMLIFSASLYQTNLYMISLMSPRMTVPPQIQTSTPIITCPAMVALGATKFSSYY